MNAPHVLRYEAALKATGRATYEGEVKAPGMLHAALVESPIANGEVVSLDLSQASALTGVAAIVSYSDAQELQSSAATMLIRDRTIHFVGQPLALVVAETPATARAGARAVRIATKERAATIDFTRTLDTAFEPAMVGRYPAASKRGDAGAALARSDLVIDSRYETAVNNHHPMETHAVVCWWEEGKAIVHTCTQAVFGTRAIIAHAFNIARDDIRVVARYLGGGFGCKGQLWWPWMLWAMLAARATGRPVRLELTRAQMFTLVGRRQATLQDLKLGFDTAGRLTAIEHHVLAQTSTHAEYSDSTAVYTRKLYACANVTTTHRLVRTNEPHPVPMRAPGSAPGLFALETALDEASAQLAIDPVELRIRNYADRDQESDLPWSSNSLRECYRVGAARFGWSTRPPPGTAADGRWRVGCGMASTLYPAIRQACKVHLRLNADASALIQCGTQDMGSGTYTVLGQMAADAFGIDSSRVSVELGDTWLPDGPFSGGSQVTASLAPAVHAAARTLRGAILQLVVFDERSPLYGQSVEDLEFRDGMVVSTAGYSGERLADILARGAPDGMEATGESNATHFQSLSTSSMGYGAIFVEVGVDKELGEVRVRRVCGAFAAGKILNPLLARSQYVGGLIGGIGMALHEKTATDRATGRIVGQTFADYLMPVHADMPEFDIEIVEEEDTHLPGGVKGIGMLGTAGIQAAIANAIFHATGKRIRHLPIRIEDLIDGLV